MRGLRVVLASCGAEEVLQGGIYGFARRHLAPLDRDRTWVINLDTVGSPALAMLEGEGAFVMEDYFDRGLRDLCERVADPRGDPAAARDARLDQHRLRDPEPDGDPDRLPDLAQPPQGALQLPLARRRRRRTSATRTVAAAADLTEAVTRELAARGSRHPK